ncbi:DUF177 domain-containing protein [Cereibacter sp. SYSU M97828]|nr:DUF177 domain-containing protein [Cereibacter flavus]
MTDLPLSQAFRVASLPTRKAQRFALSPDAATRAAVARDLEITAIRALRFEGEIRADRKHDFLLEGTLSATVEKPCIVTLAPVVTKIESRVSRRYSADFTLPDAAEVEIPEEDVEPLPEVIDVGEVAVEELSLALPPYPRAEGAELGEAVHAAPGEVPLTDADLKPFAGLQALKDKLGKDG